MAVFGVVAAAQANPAPLATAGGSGGAAHRGHLVGLAAPEDRLTNSAGASTLKGSAQLKHRPKRTQSATHERTARHPAAARSAAPSAGPVAPTAAASAKPTALTCSGTTQYPAYLPQNYATIVSFLTTHGYTSMAAVGVAGNIYQESKGNPESVGTGGGGLIGWTPLPVGLVTGNPAADLQTQLAALLTYNQQWAQYIPALDAATNPTQAADIYMDYFERPGIPAAYNRETAANAVAQACGVA
ncbi:MAG: phage tail tip lysozyme [Streptosporangiaceae bacterium]